MYAYTLHSLRHLKDPMGFDRHCEFGCMVVWWQPKSHGGENCVSFKKIILVLEVTKHKELSGIVQTIDDLARC
jgi:hypothetical protein